MENFEQQIRALASRQPAMTLAAALWQLDRVDMPNHAPPPGSSTTTNAAFAWQQPSVLAFLPDQKIYAIKELRSIGGMGLKEAKEAIDLVQEWQRQGILTPAEEKLVETEAAEAIESIRATMSALHEGARQAGVKLI